MLIDKPQHLLRRRIIAMFVLLIRTAMMAVGEQWHPSPGLAWQIQFQGTLNTSLPGVNTYDLDLFDTDQSIIDDLHSRGHRVICYFSAGSIEDWRPDAGDFPAQVIGNPLDGWEGENWLDIRQIDILGPIMAARLDLAVSKKCDAVDPDNVDGFTNDSGFPLNATHQLNYNMWLANASHARQLAIGLKNDLNQVEQLVPSFDFAINEQCFFYDECNLLLPFISNGKPVLGIEYAGQASKFCPQANAMQFDVIMKKLSLNQWRLPCSDFAPSDSSSVPSASPSASPSPSVTAHSSSLDSASMVSGSTTIPVSFIVMAISLCFSSWMIIFKMQMIYVS